LVREKVIMNSDCPKDSVNERVSLFCSLIDCHLHPLFFSSARSPSLLCRLLECPSLSSFMLIKCSKKRVKKSVQQTRMSESSSLLVCQTQMRDKLFSL
jgi:hypothetical protein